MPAPKAIAKQAQPPKGGPKQTVPSGKSPMAGAAVIWKDTNPPPPKVRAKDTAVIKKAAGDYGSQQRDIERMSPKYKPSDLRIVNPIYVERTIALEDGSKLRIPYKKMKEY